MLLEIFILDDEFIVGQWLKVVLEKEGYCVEIFVNFIQVVVWFEDKMFDIVVIDICMDDMDGIEIFELVCKKNDWIKVIMIIGYVILEVVWELLIKGVFDFIVKFFKFIEMWQVIGKVVEVLKGLDFKCLVGNVD